MGVFNTIGLIIFIIMMIPNIIFSIKVKDGFKNIYHNRTVELFENIGRFSCFILIIVNIPYTYFGFWFAMGRSVYIGINAFLLFIYILGWILFWNKHPLVRAYVLSIVPSIIFIFSGVMLLSIPLIIASVIFAFCHITISLKNAYGLEK